MGQGSAGLGRKGWLARKSLQLHACHPGHMTHWRCTVLSPLSVPDRSRWLCLLRLLPMTTRMLAPSKRSGLLSAPLDIAW